MEVPEVRLLQEEQASLLGKTDFASIELYCSPQLSQCSTNSSNDLDQYIPQNIQSSPGQMKAGILLHNLERLCTASRPSVPD